VASGWGRAGKAEKDSGERRDRRKDTLLQENGYLVLRFLAEDVGKYLDQVLDAILRALSHQQTRR
jgi:very-short-patch-repair endonuclease